MARTTPDRGARTLRLGSRGSRLALTQTEMVARLLEAAHPGLTTEIIIIQTTGDKILDSPLSRIGGKGVFTKEIEEALLGGRIDLAIHSLKDLPTAQPQGLALGAITARENPMDLLIAARPLSLASLPAGARIGTSSLRRRAQLRRLLHDVEVGELRGNVPTRIRRATEGEFTAIVLAAAGVARLGLEPPFVLELTPEEMLPAPGQGSLGLQIREGDEETARLVAVLQDARAAAACTAERALLHGLGGGCQLPLGSLAVVDGNDLRLHARVVSLDGSATVEGEIQGDPRDAVSLGESLAQELLARGARRLLEELGLSHGEGFAEAVASAAALDSGPLGGRRVVVTRDEDADGPLSRALRALGAEPILLPLVRHLPPEDETALQAAAEELVAEGRFDWLVITSSRGMEALSTALAGNGHRPGACKAKVACVGRATASAVERSGLKVDLVPADESAAGLSAALLEAGLGPATRVLYPRADRASETLTTLLRAAGVQVLDVVAYRTESIEAAHPVARALALAPPDAILFCSPSAVEAWVEAEASGALPDRGTAVVAAIGPRTADALRAINFPVDVEPVDRSFPGLAAALAERFAAHNR